MDTCLYISEFDFIDFIDTIFQTGKMVRFKAHGHSMSPFIKDGDIITLKAYSTPGFIAPGDIVAVNIRDKKIIVHRIIRIKRKKILLKGDNCAEPDGFFVEEKIIGLVTGIERNGRGLKQSRAINFFIVCLSDSGLLANYILPFLRYMKSRGMFNRYV